MGAPLCPQFAAQPNPNPKNKAVNPFEISIMQAKYPPTVHVVGNLSKLMMGKVPLDKYADLGKPIVTVCIW